MSLCSFTPPSPHAGLRIGLFGGSFDPVHAGHVHLARTARKKLQLDYIWWLPALRHRLKRPTTAFAERITKLQAQIHEPYMRLSNAESHFATGSSIELVSALRRAMPNAHMVLLVGEDCLAELDQWHNWTQLVTEIAIAAVSRSGSSSRARLSLFARRFAQARLPEAAAPALLQAKPPAWVFLHARYVPLASRLIRHESGLTAQNMLYDRPMPVSETTPPQPPIESGVGQFVLKALNDHKAEDIRVIDISAADSAIADQMVIATARSRRHSVALAGHVCKELKKAGMGNPSIEGMPDCDWVLIDAGDVIAHIFQPHVRSYYDLERLWEA